MSQNRELKEILVGIADAKRQRRQIKTALKNELEQSKQYQEVVQQLVQLKRKKKQLEVEIENGMESDLRKAEQLSLFIKDETQLLSDVALNKFMKGETIEVRDENDAVYEPRFTVKFKRQ